MILFFGIALIIVGAYFLAKMIALDSGYVLISYAGHAFEVSFWWGLFITLLSFIALYFSLRFIFGILSTTNILGRWNSRRHRKKSQEILSKGLTSYFEGDWKKAGKTLVDSAKGSYVPELNFLAAAHASQMQGDIETAQNLLNKAKQAQIKQGAKSVAVELSQAELFLETGAYQSCVATCLEILEKKPKLETANRLLLDAYFSQGDWSSVSTLLPKMAKKKIFLEEELAFFREQVCINKLSTAQEAGADALMTTWKEFSVSETSRLSVVKEYASSLIELSNLDEAEKVVSNALKTNWNEELLNLYGEIKLSDPTKQSKKTDAWLLQHKDDATLLLLAGRFAARRKDIEKAKEYYRRSLEQQEQSKTYASFGRFLENIGEKDGSLECYRKALS